MRILAISNVYPPGFIGGYELGASEIIAGLLGRGHQVEVLTSDYFIDDSGGDAGGPGAATVRRTLDCIDPNRSQAERFGRGWMGGFCVPRNLREVAGRLEGAPPDAVLCFNLMNLGPPALLRLLAASGMRPVAYLMDNVFTSQPPLRAHFGHVFGTADWPQATRFLFMSQNLREEVETTLGWPVPGSRIVPGWFDQRAVATVEPRPAGALRLVYASRVTGHKGIDILLDACRALLDQGSREFTVDIFGAGEVAPALQRLTALKIQEHVRYCGAPSKDELMPRLREYDGLIFPTWHREPFGFIVPEAAAAGCIPIMTYGIGSAEWFIGGLDCIKIEQQPSALRAAILHLMGLSAGERAAMRRRAQATALRLLSFENALGQIEAALQEAAASPVRPARPIEASLTILNEIWRMRPDG